MQSTNKIEKAISAQPIMHETVYEFKRQNAVLFQIEMHMMQYD